MGLHEDLDEIRDNLAQRLEDFESRLHAIADDLPPWLNVPGNSLRAPFQLDEPPRLNDTLIGPRAVATLAGDLEQFLSEWLGDSDRIPAWQSRNDDERTRQLADELTELHDNISAAEEAVETIADSGPLQLEQILESIVFELESRRETDVEALESMVQQGDVEPGRNARAEIAELWEEQRRRVDKLRHIWDDLLNLHYEGVTATTEGTERLRGLITRVCEGIEGAGINLDITWHRPGTAANAPDAVADEPDSSDITEPSENTDDSPAPKGPGRFLRQHGDADASSDTADTDDSEPEVSDTAVDIQPETEPISTMPASSSDTEPDAGPTTRQLTLDDAAQLEPTQDTVPTDLAEPSDAADDTGTDQVQSPSDELPDTVDMDAHTDGAPTDETVDVGGTEDSGDNEDNEYSGDDEEDGEDEEAADNPTVRVRTYRIRRGWRLVGVDEIAATLGPPALFVLALVTMSLLSLVELAPNPFTTWDWALEAGFGAMALLVILPLVLRWRPMWDDTTFRVIRRGEIDEEVDLKITDDDRLVLDRTSWQIDQLRDTELYRIDVPDGAALLTITPPYHSPVHLLTQAASQCDGAELIPADDVPGDAWQLPPEEFDTIRRVVVDANR